MNYLIIMLLSFSVFAEKKDRKPAQFDPTYELSKQFSQPQDLDSHRVKDCRGPQPNVPHDDCVTVCIDGRWSVVCDD